MHVSTHKMTPGQLMHTVRQATRKKQSGLHPIHRDWALKEGTALRVKARCGAPQRALLLCCADRPPHTHTRVRHVLLVALKL